MHHVLALHHVVPHGTMPGSTGRFYTKEKAQLYGPYNNVHSFGSSHSFSASPKFEILLKFRLQANFETNCNCSAAPRNGICLLFPSCSIINIGVVGMTRYYLYAYSSTRVQLIQYPYATNTTSSTIMLAALLPEGLLYSIWVCRFLSSMDAGLFLLFNKSNFEQFEVRRLLSTSNWW